MLLLHDIYLLVSQIYDATNSTRERRQIILDHCIDNYIKVSACRNKCYVTTLTSLPNNTLLLKPGHAWTETGTSSEELTTAL